MWVVIYMCGLGSRDSGDVVNRKERLCDSFRRTGHSRWTRCFGVESGVYG